jgi:hypothetical protein
MSGFSIAPDTRVLAQSAVQVSHTGDTAEFTFATITVPAGAMGANGAVYIEALFSMSGANNTRTPRIKFGGTVVAGGNAIASTNLSAKLGNTVQNRNSQSSQVCLNPLNVGPFLVGGTSAVTTAAIDTSASVSITITGQLTSAADTINLEAYRVILTRG